MFSQINKYGQKQMYCVHCHSQNLLVVLYSKKYFEQDLNENQAEIQLVYGLK